MKKTKKILIISIIIYLIISSLYIFLHIDFDTSSKSTLVLPGFKATTNILRLFMGLPCTFSTNQGISPVFLLEVVIKIIIAIILVVYLIKNNKQK